MLDFRLIRLYVKSVLWNHRLWKTSSMHLQKVMNVSKTNNKNLVLNKRSNCCENRKDCIYSTMTIYSWNMENCLCVIFIRLHYRLDCIVYFTGMTIKCKFFFLLGSSLIDIFTTFLKKIIDFLSYINTNRNVWYLIHVMHLSFYLISPFSIEF